VIFKEYRFCDFFVKTGRFADTILDPAPRSVSGNPREYRSDARRKGKLVSKPSGVFTSI